MAVLFKIGGVDYTSHITVPSYKVNQERNVKEWKDSTGERHRQTIRKEIKGSFQMLFDDAVEVDTFLDKIFAAADENDGYNTVDEIYVNNIHSTVENFNCYISIKDFANEKPLYGVTKTNAFTVNIEQK